MFEGIMKGVVHGFEAIMMGILHGIHSLPYKS